VIDGIPEQERILSHPVASGKGTARVVPGIRQDLVHGRVARLFVFSLPVPELWVPRPCVLGKGGYDAAGTIRFVMPSALHRTYGAHHLHFITCSCYRRLPFLSTARCRDRFLSILEQARQRYRFVVVGYVVMPEHIHLLLTEPEVGTPSTVMQVLKQRSARALLPKRKRSNPRQRNLFADKPQRRAFWQARFYDFNVWTTKKRVEKLRYMHRNPVKRALVELTEQWRWSSYRFYLLEEAGPVRVNEGWPEISFRDHVA
jgi:putative transposase